MGMMIDPQRMGAVWLLIHIDKNRPSSMIARMNSLGRAPSCICSSEARRSSNWQRLNAVEIVYPPSSSQVVWLKMCDVTNMDAFSALMTPPPALPPAAPPASFSTPIMTTSGGISSAVAKYGKASVTHRLTTSSSRDMQRQAAPSLGDTSGTTSDTMYTMAAISNPCSLRYNINA